MPDPIMEFAGPHTELFADYVRYKRAMGYSIPSSYQTVLRDISKALAGLQPNSAVVDKRAAELIAARRDGEAVSTQCKRIAITRRPTSSGTRATSSRG